MIAVYLNKGISAEYRKFFTAIAVYCNALHFHQPGRTADRSFQRHQRQHSGIQAKHLGFYCPSFGMHSGRINQNFIYRQELSCNIIGYFASTNQATHTVYSVQRLNSAHGEYSLTILYLMRIPKWDCIPPLETPCSFGSSIQRELLGDF